MAITVKVSTAQLEDAARRFDDSRSTCLNKVREMMNISGNLRGSWKGEAANNFYNKLCQIQGDLNDINKIISEHSNDLRAMEKVYVQAENTAAQKAASLDSDVLSY